MALLGLSQWSSEVRTHPGGDQCIQSALNEGHFRPRCPLELDIHRSDYLIKRFLVWPFVREKPFGLYLEQGSRLSIYGNKSSLYSPLIVTPGSVFGVLCG